MNASRTCVSVCALVVGLLAELASAVNIEMVTVGDPGNTPDTRYISPGFGAVSYTYNIGKYEVTNSQYAEFLNQVDPNGVNPYELYNTRMGSGYGGISFNPGADPGSKYTFISGRGNKPVNYVNFWDACRFANWMNNGQGVGSTETGAYSLNGVTDPPYDTIFRNPGAKVFIPSEDEWYKAAYYKSGGTNAGYWDYPTQSNTAPRAEGPAGTDLINGSANYNWAVGDLTDVGSYTAKPSNSAYGTFDQGGNLWEWNEAILYRGNYPARGCRGGSLDGYNLDYLNAATRSEGIDDPTSETLDLVGFRIAEIPEPATAGLFLLGGLLAARRRRALR